MSAPNQKVAVFWFRRDLRLQDNCGLAAALASGYPVLPVFIFDTDILEQVESTVDRRVAYIHQTVVQLQTLLRIHGSDLICFHGTPAQAFATLHKNYAIQAVYANRDYEPQAIQRDQTIAALLYDQGILWHTFKDQVVFEYAEITKKDGTPYTVYTPYANAWKAKLATLRLDPVHTDLTQLYKHRTTDVMPLAQLGFEPVNQSWDLPDFPPFQVVNYAETRDFPAQDATSHWGMALRFGTLSIRQAVRYAQQHSAVWLSQLIWRDFFMQILAHFPHVVQRCFKPAYEAIAWRNDESEFKRWCDGETGYPLVDAGMRELNQTGYMHNRVRMVVASFLCKHLLIDWRWGEAYFAQKLNDFDLAANNGNWQWAAGCGCDAAPYFRIFNPSAQQVKFDADFVYIRKWNPDYAQKTLHPIVDHTAARERALLVYKQGLYGAN